jgi:hypothetical protein
MTKTWEEEEDDMESDLYDDIKFGDQNYIGNNMLTGMQLWEHDNQQAEELMDEEKADRSQNPIASQASHPKNGMDALTSGIE